MSIRHFASRFPRDESGSTAVWTGLALTVIVGMGALAVDMSGMYATRAQLQHTADASAIAAAQALPDQSAAALAAQTYAAKNMASAEHGTVVAPGDIVAGNWNGDTRTFSPGANPVNAVRVITRRSQTNGNPVSTLFAIALGVSTIDISASAVATKPQGIGAGAGCIIALNPTVSKAFYVQGNGSVRTSNCDIQVNSCHSDGALWAQGDTIVQILGVSGSAINVCGDVRQQGPVFFSPVPNEDTGMQVADPFLSVSAPAASLYDSAGDCDFTNFSTTGDVDLLPGVYCGGITITGNGTATFHGSGGSLPNGLFIVKDGPLSIAGTTKIVGNGVTFFMTGAGAYTDFKGTADIGLSAPIGGDYAGLIFVGDRNNPATTPHLMRGTALGGYNGYMYFPNATVKMVGTANGTVGSFDCTVVVADIFRFEGTPNFEAAAECSDFSGLSTGTVLLVN